MICAHRGPEGSPCPNQAEAGASYCLAHLTDAVRATKSLGGALPVRLIENPGQVPGTATITDETGRVLGHMTGIGGQE